MKDKTGHVIAVVFYEAIRSAIQEARMTKEQKRIFLKTLKENILDIIKSIDEIDRVN